MPTIPEKPKSNYTPAPVGTHMARCYQFIHIGTIQDEYMGEPKEFNKIRLSFELPNKTKVFKEGETAKPISVHAEYTLSMGAKANLRRVVEGMIGTSLTDQEAYNFDVETLVGKPCLITIKHKTSKAGNVRDEIATVSPLMDGQVAPAPVNKSTILSYGSWDQELFDKLPAFLKEKIMSSAQYKKMFTPMEKNNGLDDATVARIQSLRGTPKVDPLDKEMEDMKAMADSITF